MAEYIIQEESLTAIADEVRELSGTSESMGLDTMATNLNDANTEVDSQEDLIMQIAETLSSKASPTPVIDISKSGNSTIITITDVEGTKTSEILDGTDGVGIKSVVQTTTSNADGGSNVITVTKTDNTTSTFTVKNGSKGNDGIAGTNGSGIYIVSDFIVHSGYDFLISEVEIPDGKTLQVGDILIGTNEPNYMYLVEAITPNGEITVQYLSTLMGHTGLTGERGASVLRVTTSPEAYTTATGGFTPTYRIALSTVLSQAGVDKVVVGETLLYSYYHYQIGYVDSSYVYLGSRVSIRGAKGTAGTTPVKGTDYYTDAEKTEFVNSVVAAVPKFTLTGIDINDVVHTWTLYGVQS